MLSRGRSRILKWSHINSWTCLGLQNLNVWRQNKYKQKYLYSRSQETNFYVEVCFVLERAWRFMTSCLFIIILKTWSCSFSVTEIMRKNHRHHLCQNKADFRERTGEAPEPIRCQITDIVYWSTGGGWRHFRKLIFILWFFWLKKKILNEEHNKQRAVLQQLLFWNEILRSDREHSQPTGVYIVIALSEIEVEVGRFVFI